MTSSFPCSFKSFSVLLVIPALLLTGVSRASGNQKIDHPISADANWSGYRVKGAADRKEVKTTSFYLTMRDGIKIAVDLHLPARMGKGEKIPAIIKATRYVRAVELWWPFDIFYGGPSDTVRRFVANGYAWLDLDARGSGASYGVRPGPTFPDEVKDYGEIVDWIVSQSWSNGKVGATGVSYDGSAAEMLLINEQSEVKAVISRFTQFDAFEDTAYPGGVHLNSFTKKWSVMNKALDRNDVDAIIGDWKTRLAVRGVKPVDDDKNRAQLKEAVASHSKNWDPHKTAIAGRSLFRGDKWPHDPSYVLDDFSPSGYISKFRQSKAAVYSYTGWFDAAYQRAAIRRYMTFPKSNNRLIIGPWSHGGKFNSSPFVKAGTRFDHDAEQIRFFDHHLKGIKTGIDKEAPIHYFTMGEGKWKATKTWPPKSNTVTLYFGANGRIDKDKPVGENMFDSYRVDYTATTGTQSRWETLIGGGAVVYPDRSVEDEKLLTYTSQPLARNMEVTGHPVITLYIESTADDGNFFVYLEDMNEKGEVTYVTEGQLRALHRKISDDTPPYARVAPYRSYKRKDSSLLKPGEVAMLVFDLLPTSYLFKRGHSIRVALAGADKDHFYTPPGPAPVIKYFRSADYPSHIALPVIDNR